MLLWTLKKIVVTHVLFLLLWVAKLKTSHNQIVEIFTESTLHLVLRLRGGAKKRKKKNYTTPKKQKHKHKKVKLAVLKYYKVKGEEYFTTSYNQSSSDRCQVVLNRSSLGRVLA